MYRFQATVTFILISSLVACGGGGGGSDFQSPVFTDTTPPTITLSGDAEMRVEQGTEFADPGASANDDTDGQVTVSVSGVVDTATAGVYILTYTATDAAGNEASTERVVTVSDTTAPTVTLNGSGSMTLEANTAYTEQGATAVDSVDGTLEVVITGSVESVPGTYTLTYTATDTAGNSAQAERTVTVLEPQPPEPAQPIIIEAEDFSSQSGTQIEGPGIGYFDNNDWLKYEAVDFGDGGHNSITFNLAVDNAYAGGKIIVRLGSLSGTVIAEHTVEATGGWTNYASQSTTINESLTGTNDIYLQGSKSSGGIANIDYFIFDEVEPQLSSVEVSPKNVRVEPSMSQQFSVTALDQFGEDFELTADQVMNWTATEGSIDQNGYFSAIGDIKQSAVFIDASISSTIKSTGVAHITGELDANTDVVHAVNVGGEAYTASSGIHFTADAGFDNGTIIDTEDGINGTPDGLLYQNQRAGDLTYRHSLQNGSYEVTVLMAEINNRNSQFDIVIEGINRFDDVQIVGSRDGKRNANYDLTFGEVDVSDGELNLEFPGNASVAGMIIRDSVTTQSWDLIWSDEFDIDGAIDPTKWTHENWAPGNVNNELQRYTSRPENSRVEGGNLIIEARRDFYQGDEYSSARIHSRGKGDLLYGRVEVRAKLPFGRGTWPAIWMMPTDFFTYATTCSESTGWISGCDAWPNSGEIDIMEHVGFDEGHIWATVHNKAYYWVNFEQRKGALWNESVANEFQIYAMEWSPTRIDIFVNDALMFTYNNQGNGWQSWPYDHPFHLILNIAVGGNWGGAQGVDENIWPQRMEIDYVRMYQRTD